MCPCPSRIGGLTTWLLALRRQTLANCSSLFQVNVPALLLALVILQGECEDVAALLDRILLLSIVLESVGNQIESGRRGPCI